MFRPVVRLSTSGVRSLTRPRPCYSGERNNVAGERQTPLASRCYSHAKVETDEEFDARWVTYFSKPDIDAWELKKGMNTLIGYDLVPEPKILDSALRACRRLNDLASAIRILEAVKDKSGPHKDIYPYLIQELQPTLIELGISTPEDLGMDIL
ncbi:cytochrome c oxidase subunit 5A, mitochondrial-like isoform X1 [Oncorhynchus keta]|uniref:cytochrome c oxidase subunit 5A, mitochondrial-like isoform X1 n=1 Tax=Oncorhynchus keta TaxID=8018 RepID=UPI0015FD64D1|nr:cytochrome c oxidase subunit 5A, mitochondrial-like isoform X1 [Oncorhynchus keta]